MDTSLPLLAIKEVQGRDLLSPVGGQKVRVRGLVTAVARRGFFLQTPDVEWDGKSSDGIFVYSTDWKPDFGAMLEVVGEVTDYLKHEAAKPVTQIHFKQAHRRRNKRKDGEPYNVTPITFIQQLLDKDNHALSRLLNSLEGMLIKIPAGQTFIAPSNPHGDYVVALDANAEDRSMVRTEHKGALVDQANPLRWYPGFRIANYNHAVRLNVGSKLKSDIIGPLNYRADAYQLAISQSFEFEEAFIKLRKSDLTPSDGSLTIMTLNCFNLDPHVESEHLVMNPAQDVDDDWGEGRFHTLAQAIVLQANTPDIVALQEIQDSDGAEMTEVVEAEATYALLIKTIEQLCGVRYNWVDVPPESGADGGQPGGNIRNAYLYNPQRVELQADSVTVFGSEAECFVDSRKPLLAKFTELSSGKQLACVNVHLASKRHQNSIFAPIEPGVDAKLPVRVAQAEIIANKIEQLQSESIDYYLTGDFNDTEQSETLNALLGDHSVNLVMSLAEDQRYDYNHRGKLQVLMHGIVSKAMAETRAHYEIIHGNELIGVTPGEESDKPSDHAYVIAKLELR